MSNSPILDEELDILIRCADQIIPGGGGWPTPQAAGIEVFFRRVLSEGDDVERVRRVLRGLQDVAAMTLAEAGPSDYVVGLQRLEAEDPVAFRVLLEFVYFGYYSRPIAIDALNSTLGCDYVSPPQPHGYVLDGSHDPVPSGRGAFIATEDVVRVDLSRLASAEALDLEQGGNPRFGNSATLFT